MANHKITSSEEMYLLSAAQIMESGHSGPIPISQIAEKLSVKSVSVNHQMKKLADLGYVTYTPYKGVELMAQGKEAANKVIRNRRIWEVFLVENLHIPFEDAESLSCDFEHATTVDVISRLEHFLGYPKFSPKGKPIPSSDEDVRLSSALPLIDLPIGHKSTAVEIDAADQTLQFLAVQGIRPGAEVWVSAINPEKSLLVETDQGSIILDSKIAENIIVEVVNEG